MISPVAAWPPRRFDAMQPADLTAVLGAVPDPMLFIDSEGRIAEINPAAEALFGAWILGRGYHTAFRQPLLLDKIEAVLNGETSVETRFVKAEQTGEVLFRVLLTPLSPEQGRPRGLVLHFTDISHLREAKEMRRDFVANVSHELRSPLTALLGFIETLRGAAQNDAAARDRFLGIMEEQALRMNRLIGDLLSLSRVESTERQRPSNEIDLREVLMQVMDGLRPLCEERGNVLDLSADEGPHRVRGDWDQLTQVFTNLAENALKYGGAGKPVTLRLGTGQGKGAMKGPVVTVEVIDRGEGIATHHLPRLTERFYRVDSHRSREMGGTGLGLAIVKHIVNRHRGRLGIASRKGEGSTFSVTLPAS